MAAELKCPEHPDLTFTSPQAFGAHNRHSHPGRAKPRKGGKKRDAGDGSVQENPDLPMPRPRKTKRKAKGRRRAVRTAKQPQQGGIMANVIQMLQDKRSERVAILLAEDPQLKEIDTAIVALGGRSS